MDRGDVFPCVATVFFFLTMFGFLALMRYLRYKETLALAEKGLVRPQPYGNGKDTLRWGIAITSVGLALCIGLASIGFLPGNDNDFPFGFFGPWMLGGLIPTFFGIGLILIYILTREEKPKNERDVPPPMPPPPSSPPPPPTV